MRKKNKVEGIPLPDFQLYYKARGTRTVGHWQKIRHTEQWNRLQSPEINPHKYSQFMTKEPRIYNGESIVSSINGIVKLDSHMQKNATRPLSYTIDQINPK